MSDVADSAKVGFATWVILCMAICFWFLTKFARGRRQFQTNLHVIEDGLRRMQEELETREVEKSIGCVGDVEDISSFLQKFHESQNQENVDGDGKTSEDTKLEEDAALEEDKKNI